MSTILYYSKFCKHSEKIIQSLSKTQIAKDIHFICIDNRIKEGNRTLIVLANNQKIVMPPNVTKVPALLLIADNYKVIYGDDAILAHLKPRQVETVKQATLNNMEPSAFGFGSFGGFGSGIASDNYSFLDMDSDALGTKGDGGMRQMHSYVSLNESFNNFQIPTPTDDTNYKTDESGDGKMREGGVKIEDLQKQRDSDLSNIVYRTGP